ncbi:MAG: class I SAM-dependent methyltransferase [Granulosicoccus sp.]
MSDSGEKIQHGSQSQWPAPDALAAAHSEQLCRVINERIIAAGGAIPFSEYMNTVLYEPGLGYYMAGASRFGEAGDFITAPEISPLFGQSLAVQIGQVLDMVGGGVLELGAGNGKLAAPIIRLLEEREGFSYSILEPSAALAKIQRDWLADHLSASAMQSVSWLTSLPENFCGVILANEVLDALPVERFRVSGQIERMCVSENLEPVYTQADSYLSEAVSAIEADCKHVFASGYSSELCLVFRGWIRSLGSALTQGVVLLADYGYPRREYYLPERTSGTLACYYRHRMHDDPFYLPGLQDITAHVDFTSVADAAISADMELLGYTSQASFLLANDLLTLMDKELAHADSESERIMLAQAVKQLTLPGEMGERFQFMALGKGYNHPLRGFAAQDLSHRL